MIVCVYKVYFSYHSLFCFKFIEWIVGWLVGWLVQIFLLLHINHTKLMLTQFCTQTLIRKSTF